jgi:hypothetical protein
MVIKNERSNLMKIANRKRQIEAVLLSSCLGLLSAQAQSSERAPGGRGGGPAFYWVEKGKGGVHVPPNKPLAKLARLKAKYAGQSN